MTRLLRHLLAILALPFVVVVVVPRSILTSLAYADTRWTDVAAAWVIRAAGVAIFLAGFALFGWCVTLFARVGRGTLAPWDPTRKLIVTGPYKYVRNPMISAVVTMLIGESVAWGSRRMAAWAAVFIVVNHLYFLASEEPGLARRFGDEYRRYAEHVPRWIPRTTPWKGS